MKTYNVNLNVNNVDLDDTFLHCPFCGSSENKKNIGTIQDKPKVEALKCRTCHLGYATRQPTSLYLDKYYKNYFDSTRHTTIKKELLIKHLMGYFSDIELHGSCNIIDFGGGDGSIGYGLAVEMRKITPSSHFNLHVVDPNSGGLISSDKNITIFNHSSLSKLDTHFEADIVIASAILEHIKNPRDVLIELLNTLKKQGRFYARTPYIFPFKYWLNKVGIRLDMGYPGHLFDMGSSFWDNVLTTIDEQENFKIRKSQTSLVETTFKEWFSRTLIAYIFKFPSFFIKKHYHFVGGWELVIVKK